jgi:radical SAM protein with 4Fe4S-binding SPASM domain
VDPVPARLRPEPAPHSCVWEITLACNARCVHCGSSAGRAREGELDGREALALCDGLVGMGVAQVTLSGGEPLRRPDWPDIAGRLVRGGVVVDMISNGLALDPEVARVAARIGLAGVTLSVDGPEAIHDELRGVRGGFAKAVEAARHLRAAGLRVGAATQVNTRNAAHLGDLEGVLADAGFQGWQIQLTMPHGRCAERRDLVLEPRAVPGVIQFVLGARRRRRLPVYAADNVGWMLRCEPELRSMSDPPDRFYPGCQAGLSILGITSDGTIRGCLSLPPAFDEGNVRERAPAEIWADPGLFAYTRRFRAEDLVGGCARCEFRRVCRGGCKSLAFATLGRVDENPWCARLVARQDVGDPATSPSGRGGSRYPSGRRPPPASGRAGGRRACRRSCRATSPKRSRPPTCTRTSPRRSRPRASCGDWPRSPGSSPRRRWPTANCSTSPPWPATPACRPRRSASTTPS